MELEIENPPKSTINRAAETGTHVMAVGESIAFVSFSYQQDQSIKGEFKKVSNIKHRVKYWGESNLLPNSIDDLLLDNSISPQLLTTKRDIILGNGISPFIEVIENGKRKQVPVQFTAEQLAWMESSGFEQALKMACDGLVKLENGFVELAPKGDGYIEKVQTFENKHIRVCEKTDNGTIPGYVLSGNWKEEKHKREFLRPYNPEKALKGVLHIGDNFLNDGYYNIPSWYGAVEFMEIMNNVPKFHRAILNNGQVLRYHVVFPKGYFLDHDGLQQAANDENKINEVYDAERQAKEDFLEQFHECLDGIDKAGSTIHSESVFDKLTQKFAEIEIKQIPVDLKDTALLKLLEEARKEVVSSIGIHTSLAGIESQGKLSSGSEMQHALDFFTKVKTRTFREHLLSVWKTICKANKWDKRTLDGQPVQYRFEDIIITRLSENPTGTTNTSSTESE